MVETHPLTSDRWGDLEGLFGPQGAYSGCWCMWWRVKSSEFGEEVGAGLKNRFFDLVSSGGRPGLLAYDDGTPVGWISLGPREEFGRLQRSPKLGPIDDEPVMAIVCFYIPRQRRRRGIGRTLLRAAIEQAERDGYRTAEGYPIDTASADRPGASVFTGTLDLFLSEGFSEVARRGGRPIVRRSLS